MSRVFWALCAAALIANTCWSQRTATLERPESQVELPELTSIDEYVRRPDDSFRWKVVSVVDDGDLELVVLDMTSQKWRSEDEVNRTEWQHWITCAVPKKLRSDTAFMMIGGGSNRGGPPKGPNRTVKQIAQVTGAVVFELTMIPNQPLIFHNDGKERVEDNLIGYTWDQYIKTGESDWLARNPMVKSAVRAMDAVTEMMASDTGGNRTVDKYVVAGGSKRGWTTWLTGAMDERVVAIIPVVIDVLNTDVSMRHHFAAYGFWAPAIGDYVQHRIMERIDHPRLREAYKLVDPYHYRHRLTMPKFIVNAAGDQFFLPDSSQFYFDDLEGPKYLRYVPNADHGLGDSDALESISAFFALQVAGKEPPQFSWTNDKDGAFRVVTETKPKSVKLWHATNPIARDFRMETLGKEYKSETVESEDGKTFVANVKSPDKGWTAYFVELTFDVGLPVPLKMTTNVRVIPDRLPYSGKPLDRPFSLTVVGVAPSKDDAPKVVEAVEKLVESGTLPVSKMNSKFVGPRCYFNWSPKSSEDEATAMTVALTKLGCGNISYQLESGPGITTLPRQRKPVVSPEIGDDGKVTFRIRADKANVVEVYGQWQKDKLELTRNDEGLWETVASVPPGVWEYSFLIDGVGMIDPGNKSIKPMRSPRTSILHVAGDSPLLHEFQDVPHGTVHLHSYRSKSLGRLRELCVYTPPGYKANRDQEYPTLYLQHGHGDNEATWTTHGKAHWILDNLIAAQQAKPMVVVMMDGHAAPPSANGVQRTQAFERDLLEDVIPFVESNYRVKADANHRAIVGLSMGGGQSLFVGLNHTDHFAWIGGFSSAAPLVNTVASAVSNAATTNERLKLLWIACGKDDFLLDRNEWFVEKLKRNKIEHEWHLTEGNHSWPVWRGYLADFVPRLFK